MWHRTEIIVNSAGQGKSSDRPSAFSPFARDMVHFNTFILCIKKFCTQDIWNTFHCIVLWLWIMNVLFYLYTQLPTGPNVWYSICLSFLRSSQSIFTGFYFVFVSFQSCFMSVFLVLPGLRKNRIVTKPFIVGAISEWKYSDLRYEHAQSKFDQIYMVVWENTLVNSLKTAQNQRFS